jgi:DNA (cytosine-5)-methyltransferase 1
MQSIGIFAGVGAIELGFERAGVEATLLCEVDACAQAVLRRHFPKKRLVGDVKQLTRIPRVDILSAGFPCQDLSQAGRTKGLNGSSSGLVSELFRLLWPTPTRPNWIVLENVPFMLQLHRGHAMSVITNALERYGYAWAYRVIDSRAFGVPQRRRRVFLVASLKEDPRPVLFGESHEFIEPKAGHSHGFYWTEGNTGIGWAVDAIPALKAGSTISIPSPPAVWLPRSQEIITPHIRDAERLQGLPEDWTRARATGDARETRLRWRLVGNAVTVPIAEWLARQIQRPSGYKWRWDERLPSRAEWPPAAWGIGGARFKVDVSEFPVAYQPKHLHSFLRFNKKPLSSRAASGVLARLRNSTLKIRRMFLRDLDRHVRMMQREEDTG